MIDPLLPLALCEATYSESPTHQRGDCFVRLIEFDGLKIVAFRGTNPEYAPDDLADLDCHPTEYPGLGDVHGGFIRNVLGVKSELIEAIGDDPWAATGHSKGGAEATLFGCLMAFLGHPPKWLITFGAARCGFEIQTYIRRGIAGEAYRNGCDPVPDAPPFYLQDPNRLQLGSPALTMRPIGAHALGMYKAVLMIHEPAS